MRKSSFRLLTVLLLTLAAVPAFAAEPQPAPLPIDLDAILSCPAAAPQASLSVLPELTPEPVVKACPNWVHVGCCPGQPGKKEQRDSCTGNKRCVTGAC